MNSLKSDEAKQFLKERLSGEESMIFMQSKTDSKLASLNITNSGCTRRAFVYSG